MQINFHNILASATLALTGIILTGCNAESASGNWQQTITGTNGNYQATIDCLTAPKPGHFQDCQIVFTDMKAQAAGVDSVQLEGGMPGHGHGLPTSPVLTLQDRVGNYRIEGLKYNMPGRWLLGFRVNGELGQDKIIFDFTI